MIVNISNDAEADIREGYCFYEEQNDGLGDYFRDCIIADIDSLAFYGGIHEVSCGYHRKLASRFPSQSTTRSTGKPRLSLRYSMLGEIRPGHETDFPTAQARR